MTRVIALVDLDDTLFQTRRKCPDDVGEDRLTALGYARDGSALSFATPRQMSFLHWLAGTARLIPVTARSLDALRRVRIPFTAAVCAHGGVVLRECGSVDHDWSEHMAAGAGTHAATMRDMAETITAAARARHEPVTARVLAEEGTPLYVLAKHDQADAAALAGILDEALPQPPAGWTAHRNGNNAAYLPPHIGKEKALAHLLPRLRAEAPEAAVIGIGDSLTDAPFMALCDFAMLPTRSQLARRLFDAR